MMTWSINDVLERTQSWNDSRVNPKLEEGIKFEVNQIEGWRQKQGQREVENL
jgi:hypothetical protein